MSVAADMAGSEEKPLPAIRDDLRLLPGPADHDGAPTWTIHDPVRNRYFRISNLAFEMIARWTAGTSARLARRLKDETGKAIEAEDVEAFVLFLRANALVQQVGAAGVAILSRIAQAGEHGWLTWLLHHYLFFRIPLLNPQRLLDRMAPWVAPLYSRAALVTLLVSMALGLFLVARQWDVFVVTLMSFTTLQGAAALAVTLCLTKIAHEFGHACTAHRLGCRVPTMGIAFLVLYPVLYTDTSDAWRLVRRRDRLAVGAAGIAVELALAAIATLLWSFLPDGPVKSAAFMVATVSWIGTLAVNLSPFMRFDGYYLLGDLWNEPNLQPRGFAFGRWALRELLFGLGDAPPEDVSATRRLRLVAYAWFVWVYRLIVFTGIALLVYHKTFKLLGIVLFAVEIGWMLVMPVVGELRFWWRRRSTITLNGATLRTIAILGCAFAVLVVPWRSTVRAPALLEAARHVDIYSPVSAMIERLRVKPGDDVAAGAELMVLGSEELQNQLVTAAEKLRIAEMELARVAVDEGARAQRAALEAQREQLQVSFAGLQRQQALLVVRAPFAGRIVDVDPGLAEGLWVNPGQALFGLVGPHGARIVAYIPEEDTARLSDGAALTFIPEDGDIERISGRLSHVEQLAVASVADIALTVPYGGSLEVRREPSGDKLIPATALYRAIAAPLDVAPPASVVRGAAFIEASATSLIERAYRAVAGVLIRESGF